VSGSRRTAAAQVGLGVPSAVFVAMWFRINSTSVTGGQKSSAHIEVFTATASVSVMLGGMGSG